MLSPERGPTALASPQTDPQPDLRRREIAHHQRDLTLLVDTDAVGVVGFGVAAEHAGLLALAHDDGDQGALAAVMVPQGFGLIRELFGDEGQQKAFAVFGPVMGLAAVAGPLLGGGLVNLIIPTLQ